MEPNAIHCHPEDNVAVVIEPIEAGQDVRVGSIEVRAAQNVTVSHKVALRRIEKGTPIFRYGHPIGRASTDIEPGQWVHTHNIASGEE